MSEFIRSTVKTLVLSAGTAGLLALGGGIAFAAPTADDLTSTLDGVGIALPGEQSPTGALPIGNETVGMRAPLGGSETDSTLSGDLTVLPEGEETLQVVLEEVEQQSAAGHGIESLLGEATGQVPAGDTAGAVTGSAPGVVPLRGAEDPAESLGLSTEGLLGKGLLGEGLAL